MLDNPSLAAIPAQIPQEPVPVDYSDANRIVSDEEKALVKDWNKRVEQAEKRVEKIFKRFDKNRKLLRGREKNAEDQPIKGMRTNLYFSNMAAILPQIYAKDPEFAVQITAGAAPERQKVLRSFAETAEKVLTKYLVKDANLKKQAKKCLRSAYATSIGWWKCSWQENRRKDPLILNQIKDTQDNLDRLQMERTKLDDPQLISEHELIMAQMKQTLAGLETQQEIAVARGIALDPVMSEDILIIDESVRSISDYTRASAISHRVWMTADQYYTRFGYKPRKAKSYVEQSGMMKHDDGKDSCLYCVREIWSQDDNRIYYLCDGEEGFCQAPTSPEWTGRRWYPFFLLAFNETDGAFYPMSDVELIEELVEEYNKNREDFVRDRQGCLPLNIARKGSSLTDEDLNRIKNREGSDLLVVSGVSGSPLSNDIFVGSLGNINPVNYDTAAARTDIEMMIGGGDAARGTVTKAKTATEAEILSQGLRGRSAERQDTMEDVFNELGPYALEILLRKLTPQEVQRVVGQDAMWPQMGLDDIFDLVSIEVRGGSTGKPDRLQDQDRWTKLLPVIKEAVQQVAELREKGQDNLANAVIELTRETLRRFDERIDIEQFLPAAPQGEDDPAMLKQKVMQLTAQLESVTQKAKDAIDQVEKGYVSAAAQIATSAQPLIAAQAFGMALQQVKQEENPQQPEEAPEMGSMQQPPASPDQLPPAAPMMSPEPPQIQ